MRAPKGGEVRRFTKFVLTHGHARDIPEELQLAKQTEKPVWRMRTAVITTSWWAQHELWMPNTSVPGPILTASDVIRYQRALQLRTGERIRTSEHKAGPSMRHSVAIKLTKSTTLETLKAAKAAGVIAVKVYPEGVTFSPEGWNNIEEMYPAVEHAASLGLVICWHGEQPGPKIDTYDREFEFMMYGFYKLVDKFPRARFNIEHISTKATLEQVLQYPDNVTGGITLHHLMINRNDVLEWNVPGTKRTGLNPFHHCRPPVQKEEDRISLLNVALNADKQRYRRFHFGPDSAGHLTPNKLSDCGCPGVFTSPVLGPLIIELFEQHGKLDHPAFEAFTVRNGARAYNLEVDEESTFVLEKANWIIPKSYGGMVPFYSGREISWRPMRPGALTPSLEIHN